MTTSMQHNHTEDISRTTQIGHTPWCTKHVPPSPEMGDKGWCATATLVHGVSVELATDVDTLGGQPGIEIFDGGGNYLTTAQVREVAAALLRAADRLDGLGA